MILLEKYLKKEKRYNYETTFGCKNKKKKCFAILKHQVRNIKFTRSDACINCGTCAKSMPIGVHEKRKGKTR